jgi:hypothetical protein
MQDPLRSATRAANAEGSSSVRHQLWQPFYEDGLNRSIKAPAEIEQVG